MSDVVVIGAGLAGLTSALRLRQAGLTVTLLTKGIGGLQLGQGSLDVLGYAPERVERPLDQLGAFVAEHPEHPYAVLGREPLEQGISWLMDTLGTDQLVGDPTRNQLYPTAIGAMRPTAVVPPSMAAGVCEAGKKFVFVGIKELKDFYPQLVAENLARTELPGGGRVEARFEHISFPARAGEADSNALNIARTLDDSEARRRFAALVKPLVREGETVGLPAALGATNPTAWREIQELVGAPVFEIPLPPPSVPGWRQNDALVQQVKDARVRFVNGTKVLRGRVEDGVLKGVTIKGTGREVEYTADHFVLATGGFESGALTLDSHNELHETVLGLPVRGGRIDDMVHGDYWGGDQPLFKAGLAVDDQMRVLDADGAVVHPNLHACGGILAGAQRWTEKSGEGIALASAVRASDAILAELKEKN
ncbi:glycerol-3-phosphate dehydrogenase subunit GlpB [Luteococcus sp. Sow4_B9]|uniref:glycerol-3-phosphate dehydrogenase subunit GlpB n=1 Tax=Luteococcus sp. Sow4_B9 TaxID=3438792 RepID=UPI003F9E17A4